MTPDEQKQHDAVIKARQADCKMHLRDRKPRDTFIGSPPTCAFCGISRANYEKTSPA